MPTLARITCVILSVLLGVVGCVVEGSPDSLDGPRLEAREALCSGATLTSSPSGSAIAGANVVWTGSASCQLANPDFEFLVQDAITSTWSIACPYSTSNACLWQVPQVAAGSVYHWEVWAREAGSTSGYETYAVASLTVAPPAGCGSVSSTTSPSGVATVGTSVGITSSATGCSAPQYEVLYQPPGAAWQVLSPYSSSATYSWSTTGASLGTYNFEVWVREQGSANAYDAFDSFSYQIVSASNLCSSVSTTTSPSGVVVSGHALTITSSATGCSSPTYEVLYQPPGASWQTLQPYSASGTYVWDTTGALVGAYQFQVWARQSGNASAYDSYDVFSIDVTPPPSVGVSTSPSLVTPGTTVNIQATTTSVTNPEYELWEQPPGGAWQLLQGYSPPQGSSWGYNWSTTGLAPGTYQFQAWARQTGDGNAYDVYNAFSVVIHPAPCTSVSMTSSPLGTAWNGTQVTFTFSATGCSQPTYQVYHSPPGDPNLHLIQPYSSSPTFVWDTTGQPLGQHYFYVYVLEANEGTMSQADANTSSYYDVSGPCTGTPGCLVAGEPTPEQIAVDATHVYWIDAGLQSPPVFAGSAILSCPIAGCNGQPTTVAAFSQTAYPAGLAVDATSIYWTEQGSGRVVSMPIGGGSQTVLASGLNTPFGLVVKGGYAYFTTYITSGGVFRVPIGGGTPTLLASSSNPNGIVANATNLFWISGNAVMTIPIGGGTPTTVTSGGTSVVALAADATNVYAALYNQSQNTSTLVQAPIAGGSPITLYPAAGGPISSLAADAANVYFGAGSIFKVPIGGGAATTITSGTANGIAVDGSRVYWTDAGGSVMLHAK